MPQQIYFSDVLESEVDQYAEFMAALLAESLPNINMRKGTVFYQLVLKPAAAMHVYEQHTLDQIRDWWNIASIAASPTEASPYMLDLLYSNFNAARNAGAAASGQVEVILSALQTTVIQAGTLFTAGSTVFQAAASYSGVKTSTEVLAATDRLIRERADGNYSFLVDVTAASNGVSGNVAIGTAFTLSPEPTNLVAAYAYEDFSGGMDADTNETVIQRVASGIVTPVLNNRSQAGSLFKAVVSSTTASAVIGMQDPEMIRDQRGLLGISNGGKVDAYVRTQPSLTTTIVEADGVDQGDNVWQIVLSREDTLGAIRVEKVTKADDSSSVMPIVSQVWDRDFTNAADYPDIQTAQEAAFSCYQKVTITLTDLADGGSYDVYLSKMPNLSLIQTYCISRDREDPMADWLVRAPIPMLTSATLTVKRPSGLTLDTTALQTAVIAAVNAKSFVTELDASVVTSAVQALLTNGAYVATPIELIGELVKPDRSVAYLKSGYSLEPPTDYTQSVSYRTIAFFTDVSRVQINQEVL